MTLCGDILAGKQARKQKSLFGEALGASGTSEFFGEALGCFEFVGASESLCEAPGALGSIWTSWEP